MSPSILSERYKSNSDIHLEKTFADLIYDVSCHTVIHTVLVQSYCIHSVHSFSQLLSAPCPCGGFYHSFQFIFESELNDLHISIPWQRHCILNLRNFDHNKMAEDDAKSSGYEEKVSLNKLII